jgi:hypothetical protein
MKSGGIAPPPPLWCLILAAHFGVLATPFGVSPRVGVAKSRCLTGGVAWVALSRAFPKTQGISFLSLSPNYMTSGLFS